MHLVSSESADGRENLAKTGVDMNCNLHGSFYILSNTPVDQLFWGLSFAVTENPINANCHRKEPVASLSMKLSPSMDCHRSMHTNIGR